MYLFFTLFLFSFSLKPIYLIGGFSNSPIYGTISDHSLYPECPSEMNKTIITEDFINNNPDCIAKLLRVQLNPTTGEVQQLPGIITDSSNIGPSTNLINSFSNIIEKAKSKGYVDDENLFSVGYNYYLHPITSYAVYDKLKSKIEEVYTKTHEKAVIISYDQGTSFLSIFISNYSSTSWAEKYIDSVIFIGPTFAGTSSFDYLLNQNLPNFPENDEIKKSIMRMPGLHISLPNYAVFDDQTIIYNMNKDFDQHSAAFSFEFLKLQGKVDEESSQIFKANVEKYLKLPISEPPIPSLIIYNDGIKMKSRYSVFQHQNGKVAKMYNEPSDGTITPNGANYACMHWKSSTCKNLYDTTTHESLLTSEKVTEYVFDYIVQSKPIQEKKKLGLFIVSGFQGSPLYATVTDASKATMCPSNLNHTMFHSTLANSRSLIDDSGSFWLSDECMAMLARVELDSSEKFVNYAPGIHLESSKFGEFDNLLSYTKIIPKAFQEGYTQYKDFFGVGYNYMLHPLMTGEVYEKLKLEIEKYYDETGQRSVITGHSQGTSFVEIFITDYVSKEWAEKYVQGVIFYAPAFSGWGTYGRLVSSNYGSPFPDSKAEMKTSTQRMPGLHIMMPNEGVYGNKTVITNYPNQGDNSNASYALPLLKQIKRMDETAEKIFHLTDKYRKPPLPEPPVPSLVIYNNKTSTGNGYNYNSATNTVSTFNGVGDGTVSSDGPEFACQNWKNVQCYNYNLNGVNHGNIQEKQITLDLTFDFINNIQAFRPLNSNNYQFFEGVNGKYSDSSYINTRKIDSSRLTYHATGDNPNYPLSNAFDEAEKTFFVSNITNTDQFHNSIYINFDKNLSLEAFLYDTAYSSGTNYMTFHGIAKQLKVFGSSGNEPYELKSVFIGTPTYPSKRFQFVFKEPIFCDKIKIEFVDLTPNDFAANGKKNPTVGNLILIEHFDGIPISLSPVGGNFADSTYVNNNRVPNNYLTYSGSEGINGYPLSNVFDDKTNSLWIAKNENTNDYHNYIEITFKNQIKLEAILYDSGYSSGTQTFYGFPKRIKVLSAKGNDELTAKATFYGLPTWPDKRYQFVFNEPITCDKIRIEFMEVTPESTKSNGKLCPLVGNLFFIKQVEIQKANIIPVEGQYANSDYINERKIAKTKFTSSATSERNDRPLSNAFDDADGTFWIAGKPNTYSFHNYIDISFESTMVLEAFLYDSGFSSGSQVFHGFPLVLKIHSATGDEQLKENTLFVGTPTWPNKKYQFVFNEPIVCDKIRIEFIDVTPESSKSNGQLCPLVGNLHFIQKIIKLNNVDIVNAQDKFNDPYYLNNHLVPNSMFEYDSTESKTNYPLSNLFDNKNGTFWVSQNPNTDDFHNTISINFTSVIKLEALLFDYSFYSAGWIFHGAPKQLLVHTSIGKQQYQQHTLFTGDPSEPHKRYQFVFKEPVQCDKILIEFVEVTPEAHSSNGALNPMLANIHIVQAFDYDIRSIVPTTGFYSQDFYKSEHRVPNDDFTYYGTEGQSGKQLSNAFDDTISSFWIAQNENTDTFINYIDISFKNQIKLEAILYDSGYSSGSQTFHGFPKRLNIYTATGDNDFQLHTVFVGTPTWPDKQYQFVFSQPVSCDKVRLEFVEVTPESSASGGKLCPLVGNLFFYQYLDLPQLTYSLTNGNYADNTYVNSHKVDSSLFTPTSSGAASSYPLSNCFDGSDRSLWISSEANTDTFHNYIEVTFKNTVALEAFLYNGGYSSSTETYHGFPLNLIVHTSTGTNKMMPITQFIGRPTWNNNNKRFQFVFTNKIICDKIRIEFVEITPEGSVSNNALKPMCVELIFIQSSSGVPEQTPVATISSTPMPSHSPLPLEVNCLDNNRCEAQGNEKQKVNVDVLFSGFIDLDNALNGGAILLKDVSFSIKDTTITRCTAEKGGGGGIYIINKNNEMNENGFTGLIENIVFDGCKAEYGGAIYIYSMEQINPVYIQKCYFTGNTATLSQSSDNLHGGSAIFLQVQCAIIKKNKFKSNIGAESLKIMYLQAEDGSSKLNLLNSNNKFSFILISSCDFQINNLSSSSVFYVAGESGTDLELNDCDFSGDLKKGAFHINGIVHSKNAPKMRVTNCRFNSEQKVSINLDPNNRFITVDLKNQMFKDDRNMKSGIVLIVLLLSVLAIVAVIALIVLIKKVTKMERSENYDDSNDDTVLDQNTI